MLLEASCPGAEEWEFLMSFMGSADDATEGREGEDEEGEGEACGAAETV